MRCEICFDVSEEGLPPTKKETSTHQQSPGISLRLGRSVIGNVTEIRLNTSFTPLGSVLSHPKTAVSLSVNKKLDLSNLNKP
jgi:hypothetical protein